MILTFVIVCLISVGKLVQPMSFHGQIIDLVLTAAALAH